MTRDGPPSGSDRIFEALGRARPEGEVEIVVNVQGDLPTIEPGDDRRSARGRLPMPRSISATLAVEIDRARPSAPTRTSSRSSARRCRATRLRALYFTRATAPWGEGPLYHHIGLYAYRRAALERFVALAASPLEKRERLEQLRALEAGMRIDVEIVRRCRSASTRRRSWSGPRQILARGEIGSRHGPGRRRCPKDQPDLLPGRTGRQFRHRLPQHVSRRWSRCPARPSRTPSTRSRPARPISP